MNRKCVECGKPFSLSDSEIDFYKSKNLNLPKRCKPCRDKKKTANGEYRNYTANAPLKNRDIFISAILFIGIFVNVMSFSAYNKFTLPILIFDLIGIFAIFCLVKIKKGVEIQEFDTCIYPHTFYDVHSMVEHYVKHGKETNCKDMEEYLYKTNFLIGRKNILSKKQKDGDTAYFDPHTNEFAVVAKAGYIRTYFIASLSYYNKQ